MISIILAIIDVDLALNANIICTPIINVWVQFLSEGI